MVTTTAGTPPVMGPAAKPHGKVGKDPKGQLATGKGLDQAPVKAGPSETLLMLPFASPMWLTTDKSTQAWVPGTTKQPQPKAPAQQPSQWQRLFSFLRDTASSITLALDEGEAQALRGKAVDLHKNPHPERGTKLVLAGGTSAWLIQIDTGINPGMPFAKQHRIVCYAIDQPKDISAAVKYADLGFANIAIRTETCALPTGRGYIHTIDDDVVVVDPSPASPQDLAMAQAVRSMPRELLALALGGKASGLGLYSFLRGLHTRPDEVLQALMKAGAISSRTELCAIVVSYLTPPATRHTRDGLIKLNEQDLMPLNGELVEVMRGRDSKSDVLAVWHPVSETDKEPVKPALAGIEGAKAVKQVPRHGHNGTMYLVPVPDADKFPSVEPAPSEVGKTD